MQFSGVSRALSATLRLPQLGIGLHNVELVKWVAVAAMLCDHINSYLLHARVPALFFIGRIAFPLFAVAFGVSLCGRDQATMARAARRTFVWACISQPLTWLVRDHAPFNVLFVLAAGVLIVSQVERRSWWVVLSVAVGLLLCPLAEFSVAGLCLACAGVYFGRHRSMLSAVALVASVAFLEVENRNHFALLALPVLFIVARMGVTVPRIRNVLQYVYAGQWPLLWLARVAS